MGIITLLTDLGLTDHYVASLKGAIYKASPEAKIVDVTHFSTPFDVRCAAYHIIGVIADFPDDTVHVIGVNSEPVINLSVPEKSRMPSIMKFKNQYFVATDNGVFNLILNGEEPQGFWIINDFPTNPEVLFDTTKTVLIPAACRLINGDDIQLFASQAEIQVRLIEQSPVTGGYFLTGDVKYIDYYGNIITNVKQEHMTQFGENVPFEIRLDHRRENIINTLSTSYFDIGNGEYGAFINTMGYLEIVIKNGANANRGGVSKLLGITYGSTILIEFMPQGSKNTFF